MLTETDRTRRVANYLQGEHCLYCGFCLNPWTGLEVGDDQRVHDHCWDLLRQRGFSLSPWERRHLATLPVKHYFSFVPCDTPRDSHDSAKAAP